MFNRGMLFVIVLVAAVVVPYVVMDDGLSKTAKGEWQRYFGKGDAAAGGASAGLGGWFSTPPATLASVEPGPELPPVALEEALRLDISPVWVTSRWSRVSTVLGETDQMGLRVALVTGTEPQDVAGSLTYYFDTRHQLQRITFTGLTGDESRIITHLMNRFGLKPQPTIAAGLYQAPAGPNKMSQAQVNHLPVVRSAAVNTRVELLVDLHRPQPVAPVSAAKEPEKPRGPHAPGPRIW
jgi:hypothetical protein